MLMQKFKTNDVVTLKLVSGEEVIGYFAGEDNSGVMLRKPVSLIDMGDQKTMGFSTYFMSSDELTQEEVLFASHVIIAKTRTSNKISSVFSEKMNDSGIIIN